MSVQNNRGLLETIFGRTEWEHCLLKPVSYNRNRVMRSHALFSFLFGSLYYSK